MKVVKFTIPAFQLSNFDWGTQRSGELLVNGIVKASGNNIGGNTYTLNLEIGDVVTFKKYFRGRLDNVEDVKITEGLGPHYNFRYA